MSRAGIPNRDTRIRQRAERRAKAAGISPLEYFLSIMRDEDQPDEFRFLCAKAAAPYCHPRLQSVTVSARSDATARDVENGVLLEIVRSTDTPARAPMTLEHRPKGVAVAPRRAVKATNG